jgi:acetoin utilization deacetylase AcuC-like enzyme
MLVTCALVPAPAHDYPDHPENPQRFAHLGALRTLPLAKNLKWIDSRRATEAEVARVHTPEMIAGVREAAGEGPGIIDYAPTYVAPGSFEAALEAAGATIECARAVLAGATPSAFAIVRPPGHHAEPDRPMGFCLFNNLAVAVRDALAHGTSRVLIVDFDAHHGNGTQAAFQDEPRVAYLSTHQGGIYPGSGHEHEAPSARGRIVNVPLPAYAGDRCFARVLQELAEPLARAFQPQALFVSAGYDAHWRDPITSLGLSTNGFHAMVAALAQLAREAAQDRLVLALEGGYDPRSLLANIHATLSALCGLPAPADEQGASPVPEPDIADWLARLRAWHGL